MHLIFACEVLIGWAQVFKARAMNYTVAPPPPPGMEASVLVSEADSNSIYCNTVCKPGTDYSSEDNVSDTFLFPLAMTNCLGQVGKNCNPGACDDKLCIDALTANFTSAAALTQEAAAATSEAARAASTPAPRRGRRRRRRRRRRKRGGGGGGNDEDVEKMLL